MDGISYEQGVVLLSLVIESNCEIVRDEDSVEQQALTDNVAMRW